MGIPTRNGNRYYGLHNLCLVDCFANHVITIFMAVDTSFTPIEGRSKPVVSPKPDELTPVQVTRIPSEVRPIIDSMNVLFGRINEMFARERQFTSDAAHELRSPLAALRVQAEVVQIAGNNADIRNHAVANLSEGIDRATRLVDQLLMLSRLESSTQLDDITVVSWPELIEAAIKDVEPEAKEQQTTIINTLVASPLIFKVSHYYSMRC